MKSIIKRVIWKLIYGQVMSGAIFYNDIEEFINRILVGTKLKEDFDAVFEIKYFLSSQGYRIYMILLTLLLQWIFLRIIASDTDFSIILLRYHLKDLRLLGRLLP